MATAAAGAKRLIELVRPTDSPKRVLDLLADAAIQQGWRSNPTEAREWAERIQGSVVKVLRRHLDKANAVGRPPSFTFNSSSEYFIQGAAFVEPRDPDDIKAAKQRLARLETYVDTLRSLQPSEFEALCAGVLGELGVSHPRLTPLSRDEGIDFYGELRFDEVVLGRDVFPTVQRQMRMWMVGQAKKYRSGQVSTPDLREMVGSVELAKSWAGSAVSDLASHMRLRVCDPVCYLFFTTGTISAPGWSLIERTGIVAMDGEMMASFLASREVGVRNGELDRDALRQWIGQQAGAKQNPG